MPPYRIVERNLRAAMRCYSRSTPRGSAADAPGLALTSCGADIAVFNSALPSAPLDGAGLDSAAAEASSHFSSRGVGWSLWLCDDLFTGPNRSLPQAILLRHGLTLVAQPPGMYAESLEPPIRPPASIECRRIDGDRARLDFAHISSVVFALPFASARLIYGGPAIWQSMTGWIGYVDGKAVAVVTVVIEEGTAGVYSLGTLPQHQGRGYGETLLRHALEQARQETGITRTVLESTDQGFALYLRLGYRVVTGFRVYTRETCGPL